MRKWWTTFPKGPCFIFNHRKQPGTKIISISHVGAGQWRGPAGARLLEQSDVFNDWSRVSRRKRLTASMGSVVPSYWSRVSSFKVSKGGTMKWEIHDLLQGIDGFSFKLYAFQKVKMIVWKLKQKKKKIIVEERKSFQLKEIPKNLSAIRTHPKKVVCL